MDIKVSPLKSGGLSPSDCLSDPEEKEFSDEDDDDRNHKHRRRETRSQSMERESLDPVFARTYRKRNKPFENGNPLRGNENQPSEGWKNYNMGHVDKDLTPKFERRRPGFVSSTRGPFDMNQRIRASQMFSGEFGPGRGRGRDSSWNQRDPRFTSIDIPPQVVHQGPIAPGIYTGRGLANVSNVQGASWNAFGLIPGIPNGGMDALHSIGLQGTLRPAVNSLGVSRQRCRDFEERGFCLRGDMCPMEHGVNRIVVDDVQSLSQFNLPVSLASAQLVGPPAGPGVLPSLMNGKGVNGKGSGSKAGIVNDGLGLNGAYTGAASVNGADLYDPDQPLWNHSDPEASGGLLALHSPKSDETESLMSADPSDHHISLHGNANNEYPSRTLGVTVGSQGASSSVWGRISSTKKKLDVREKSDSAVSTSDYLENETKEDQDTLVNNVQGTRQGKQIIADDVGPKAIDTSVRRQTDNMRNTRKPSQKALRTLFVNGIPLKNNKREALLSHFQKFGEVIDIYIPVNSERAFVQFSKREEAEAALRAPDAVMGNRFIKLWWANRDSIPEDGMNSGGSNSVSVTPRGVTTASVLPHPSANRGMDNVQSAVLKDNTLPSYDGSLPPADQAKPVNSTGPKVTPSSQKKLEGLGQLKEELRKKQELLEQKRNDFRRQLDKLQKQATGVKGDGDTVVEQAAKRSKVDVSKASTSRPGSSIGLGSPHVWMIADKSKSVETVVSSSPKMNTTVLPQESIGSKFPIHPFTHISTLPVNRYKLDNRPTTFRIVPPLPEGLANVDALKEYFSSYGEVSAVALEDVKPCDDQDGTEKPKIHSARVSFTTRHSAERAFLNGKCWQGNTLQFAWVNDRSTKENSAAAPKCPVDVDVLLPSKKLARMDSQESSASGNGEPENSEKNNRVCRTLVHEFSETRANSVSSEKESPKHEPSQTSISAEEESMKREPSPTTMSGEKDSPKSDIC